LGARLSPRTRASIYSRKQSGFLRTMLWRREGGGDALRSFPNRVPLLAAGLVGCLQRVAAAIRSRRSGRSSPAGAGMVVVLHYAFPSWPPLARRMRGHGHARKGVGGPHAARSPTPPRGRERFRSQVRMASRTAGRQRRALRVLPTRACGTSHAIVSRAFPSRLREGSERSP